jgi:hypothetical protein
MNRRSIGRAAAICTVAVALFAGRASASYHTFRINEVYSNPSGTVQFIEFKEVFGFAGQSFVTEAPDVRSSTHTFVFPSDLPSFDTANKSFLLATDGYAAIAGAPPRDYTLPANFFNPAGDTLQYGSTGPDGVVDLTTFGAMPANTLQSLNRVGTSGNSYAAATNSPTNFAGTSGTIPEPGRGILIVIGAASTLAHRKARR